MHAPELRKYSGMYELVAGMDTDAERRSIFAANYGAR
jgi:predicted dehydrogenase